MIDNKKTVLTVGAYSIVRIQSYGFRCNTLKSKHHSTPKQKCASVLTSTRTAYGCPCKGAAQ